MGSSRRDWPTIQLQATSQSRTAGARFHLPLSVKAMPLPLFHSFLFCESRRQTEKNSSHFGLDITVQVTEERLQVISLPVLLFVDADLLTLQYLIKPAVRFSKPKCNELCHNACVLAPDSRVQARIHICQISSGANPEYWRIRTASPGTSGMPLIFRPTVSFPDRQQRVTIRAENNGKTVQVGPEQVVSELARALFRSPSLADSTKSSCPGAGTVPGGPGCLIGCPWHPMVVGRPFSASDSLSGDASCVSLGNPSAAWFVSVAYREMMPDKVSARTEKARLA